MVPLTSASAALSSVTSFTAIAIAHGIFQGVIDGINQAKPENKTENFEGST
jgi:hypothetical protein